MPAESIASTFGVDWPHLLAQIVSFGLVCALLHRLAYRPILHMLEVRRRQIAQGLENTARIEAELARTRAAREHVLKQAALDGARLVEEAKAVATRVRLQETDKAMAAAKEILAHARETAARDRMRMLADVRKEIGRLVARTTAVVTGKILTPDDQRRLAEEAIGQLPS
jgi:F-type H+-transporting ATPase subunit b